MRERKNFSNFGSLSQGCEKMGIELSRASLQRIPNNPQEFSEDQLDEIESLIDKLEDDEDVQAVFINIFGGIVRCDRVAQGVVEALGSLEVKVPIIIRLQGTNAEEGAKILDGSDLEFTVALELREAAEAVAAAVKAA